MNDAETRGSQQAGFDLGLPQAATAGGSYRVLARKYRPATFDDVIGQDAMVRTLRNAFETGRIPQAWILTGVRGVGKTTTARILARALNYEGPGVTGPTIHMPALGPHCTAIMESRHVDVIEMDAASHNGVDDVRQINDAVRYAPASARYKVYILDEVHMLSGAAFNALLKTLEEPPAHVKFVFATTEIRKVPVTVLSRCQRFDLRRVEAGTIVDHLAAICGKETITAEPEALAMIARAAEGSVRDALSLLDQAIAHAAGPVRASDVQQMLGLADRARVIDLFEALMRGDVGGALEELRDQYDSGADPSVTLIDLADFTHFVTRIKIVPAVADDPAFAEVERKRGRDFAATLSIRVLSRTWQMLLKGIPEVQAAAKPLAAAEMVLVRVAYVADLPAPEELIRALDGDAPAGPARSASATAATSGSGGGARPRLEAARSADTAPAAAPPTSAPRAAPPSSAPRAALAVQPAAEHSAAPLAIGRFEDVIALAAEKRDLMLKAALERDVRLVRIEDGRLELALEPGASKALVNEVSRKLADWTGRRWMVVVSGEAGAPTLKAQADVRQQELAIGVAADPLVQAVLARFPGAQIVGVRGRGNGDSTEPWLLPDGAGPEPAPIEDVADYGADGASDDSDDDR
jgi:DNA polymerase III subunit gamma/tau